MTKILIVEDNEMNRDMLSRRLSRKGYEIEIAVDGVEGLVMMRNNTPDLCLWTWVCSDDLPGTTTRGRSSDRQHPDMPSPHAMERQTNAGRWRDD